MRSLRSQSVAPHEEGVSSWRRELTDVAVILGAACAGISGALLIGAGWAFPALFLVVGGAIESWRGRRAAIAAAERRAAAAIRCAELDELAFQAQRRRR